MFCRNCGSVVGEGFLSCHNCGQNPNSGTNYCPQCGHFCIPGDVRCIQCGTNLSVVNNPMPQQQPGFVPEPPRGFAEPQKPLDTKIGPKFLPADKKYCRNCGLVIPANSVRCQFCDAPAGANYCYKCGSGTTNMDTVCSVCATPLTMARNVGTIPAPVSSYPNVSSYNATTPDDAGEQRDFLMTLLLCAPAFLGFFGFHRFYTGHILSGIVQLLTGGLCGIWWVIDVIMILTDSYTDKNGRKLRHK